MIVLALAVALVAAVAIGIGAVGARAAAADALAALSVLQADQRHALVLARVESDRATRLRPPSADV